MLFFVALSPSLDCARGARLVLANLLDGVATTSVIANVIPVTLLASVASPGTWESLANSRMCRESARAFERIPFGTSHA